MQSSQPPPNDETLLSAMSSGGFVGWGERSGQHGPIVWGKGAYSQDGVQWRGVMRGNIPRRLRFRGGTVNLFSGGSAEPAGKLRLLRAQQHERTGLRNGALL
eukprot:221988-Prorocentrum_minimum.AAC.1